MITQRVAGRRADSPVALHLQVRVDSDVAIHPGEQVLTARYRLDDRASGEIGGGVTRYAEVAANQHAAGERFVEGSGGSPHHVAFGHDASMPPWLRRRRRE